MTWMCVALVFLCHKFHSDPYTGRIDDGWSVGFVDLVTEDHVAISDEMIANCPTWDMTSNNPPFSARAALRAIQDYRETKLPDPQDWEWALNSITLYPLDAENQKWCWIALFTCYTKSGGFSGRPIEACAYVLMDGTVVGIGKGDYNSPKETLEHKGLISND